MEYGKAEGIRCKMKEMLMMIKSSEQSYRRYFELSVLFKSIC